MINQISKGVFLITTLLAFTIGASSVLSEPQSGTHTITVYKNQSCGCCNKWIDHLKEHGFQVDAHNTTDLTEIKTKYGVPGNLSSCHTAFVEGYVVEGHVPADVILKLLKERPKVVGITVPGMPIGSPGMEGAYSESYDILTFDKDGKTQVYTSR
ncbi:MAG TPA: DUF411 domain-containing protein [Thermodesulfobacteriota bacterium]|jgi:hypothetical protein